MMRPLAFLTVLMGMGTHAQNWALLNPAYKYNYSNDGSDTISNQIFVTHIDTLGVDSALFELNPVAEHCAPCTTAPPGCDGTEGLFIARPQLFGIRALHLGESWYLIGDDSLLVHPHAALGEQWVGPGGLQGMVSFVSEQVLFGQMDSIKIIDYADGRSITISKELGITTCSADGTDHTLIGIQSAANVGEQLPGIPDIFDYQPGDVLQYHGLLQGTDGLCYHYTEYTRKYTVLTRTDLPGHTDYSLRKVYQQYSYGQPVFGSWDCGGYEIAGVDTVPLGIDHERWSEGNFLGNSWLDQLWPKAFGPQGDPQVYQGDFGADFHGIQWHAYIDADQRYVFEPMSFQPGQADYWQAFAACDPDTSYRIFNYDLMMHRYVEGVGRVRATYFLFEHTGEEELIGYAIGGNTSGTILPDDIILLSAEQRSVARPILAPNPASDELTISGARLGSVVMIIEMNGRLVLRQTLKTVPGHLDLRHLGTGVYMLSVDGAAGQRLMVVR